MDTCVYLPLPLEYLICARSSTILQVQIPHFVRMISLVMADQLRTVVLNSINAFSRLWDAFDLATDPHAASAGCPLENQDGSTEVRAFLLLGFQLATARSTVVTSPHS